MLGPFGVSVHSPGYAYSRTADSERREITFYAQKRHVGVPRGEYCGRCVSQQLSLPSHRT